MTRKSKLMFRLLSVLMGVTMILSAAGPLNASASTPDLADGIRRGYHPQTGKLTFLGADAFSPIRVERAMERGLSPEARGFSNLEMYAGEFGIRDVGRELRVERSNDMGERKMVRYQQVLNGIPVLAGELNVNMLADGSLLSINGEVSPELEVVTEPGISAEAAQQAALTAIGAAYNLEASQLTVSEAALWIFDERLMQDEATQPAHLVWRMEVTAEEAPLRELVLVNAQTGAVSLHFNQIDTAWRGEAEVEDATPMPAPGAVKNQPLGVADTSLNRFVAAGGTNSGACTDYTAPCATINYAISVAASNDKIGIAEGVYTGTGYHVVTLDKSVTLSGGWDPGYTTQSGYSTIDGEGERRGVYVKTGLPTIIDRFIIQNGYATFADYDPGSGQGGGLYLASFANITISNSIIRNNNVPREWDNGGGIWSYASQLNLVNSAVIHNFADEGGGLWLGMGNVSIQNSTISENTARKTAGGMQFSGATTTVMNSTISNNHAPHQSAFTGGMTVENSIIAGEGADACAYIGSVNMNVVSNGHNLLDNTCNMNFHPTDIRMVILGLGTLLNIGYQPLTAGSPAIGKANPATCLTQDTRGVTRDAACDIGAYEYTTPGTAAALYVNFGDDQEEGLLQPFPQPLSAVAVDSQGTPVPGVTVTFSAPAAGPSLLFNDSGTNETVIVTDAGGVANTSTFKANTSLGSFLVNASAPDIAGPAVFHLTNFFWLVIPAASGGNDANDCLTPATACATISGVMSKPEFSAGDEIGVSVGTFDGDTLTLAKDVVLLGGWNTSFTDHIGATTWQDPVTISANTNVSIQSFSITATGGTALTNFGTLTLKSSSLYGNQSGIYNEGHLKVVNSSIFGNNSPVLDLAGGVTDQSISLLINTTITGNTGKATGGLLGSGETSLVNTIIIGNTATISAQGNDCRAGMYFYSIISLGHNIMGRTTVECGADWGDSDQYGTAANPIAVTRVLAAKRNYGNGVVAYPLKLGSLAVDAGNSTPPGSDGISCPLTDQLGTPRPQGAVCDIGALEYEFESSPPDALLKTYTANHSLRLPGTLECSGNDGICVNDDGQVKSAHKLAYSTYQKYKAWHTRDSIDGQGIQLSSTVRYGLIYGNAFWNGTMMVYGDRYGFALADDVVAHELTHGVTQYESNLFYWYQSGAINESFSDLWGEAVDQTNGLGNDAAYVKWLMGEDILDLGAIRNMQDPTRFGDPDSMTSRFYCKTSSCLSDNGGVHTNSGINNKAVYLMVEGGTFNGKTVAKLGWSKLLTIYYEAQTNLLTSGSDYLDLYNNLYQACQNKIGSNGITSANCTAVRNATLAVRMNQPPGTTYNPQAGFCPSGTVRVIPDLFFEDFESGLDGWTFKVSVGGQAWRLSGVNAVSGTTSLWADDELERTDSIATAKTIYLPPNSKLYLHFPHSYVFDFGGGNYYDGGVVEYQVGNNGAWKDIKPLFNAGQNYDGTLEIGGYNALGGRMAFAGESHGFVDSRYNLTSLAGKAVGLRWRMGTDSSYGGLGWYVDNIRVYRCVAKPSVPVLKAPANGTTVADLTPYFDWGNSTPDLHHYQLQLATVDTFIGAVTYDNILLSNFSLTSDLAANTKYFWRVRAVNAAGKASAWSTTWSFRTP